MLIMLMGPDKIQKKINIYYHSNQNGEKKRNWQTNLF